MDKEIYLNKAYRSEEIKEQPPIKFDKHHKKRPSWVKIDLNKKIIFTKILVDGEAFWYRRYFQDYFLPLEANSEDTKNFYNVIAKKYESFVPHQKEIGKILAGFLKELKISENNKILDVGAGTGIVDEELSCEGFRELTLLDISKEELKIAKGKKSLKGAKFIEADLTKDKIWGKYDVIFETLAFNELIEKNILTILKNISESLNDNGMFIMIDRHIFSEIDSFFKKIKSGKFPLKTPEGIFDYYFYIGKK